MRGLDDVHVDQVIERLRAPSAKHASAAVDDLEAGLEALGLPDRPEPVDHGVVHKEGRVVGRDVEVTTYSAILVSPCKGVSSNLLTTCM